MAIIPYGKQWIDEEDIEAVVKVLKSDWLTQGPDIESFEKALSDYIGTAHAVVFNSGTAALHAAMFASGVQKGDEVITSPITFAASSNSAIYLGATPVFADITLENYCIDIVQIEASITNKTKAIVPVDLAGYPVEIDPILDLAKKHNLVVIEDAAHALGAKREKEMVGQQAHMTMFSFHPVKHITTGEGGVIVTNSDEYAEKLKLFRSHGITKDKDLLQKKDGPWYYEMQELGYNYRLTDMQCALGESQLKKIERFVQRRNEIAQKYDEAFRDSKIRAAPKATTGNRHAYHLYPVLVENFDRKELYLNLREKGIYTQVHYIPVHLQPYYQKQFGFEEGDFPNSESYYERELSLPMFPKLTDQEQDFVIRAIKEIIGE
jgi:UDP-4-amino-4,6-dideoxy-N-acetyl-beta-L-altrosamine transaminase